MTFVVDAPYGAIVRQKKLFWWSDNDQLWQTWKHVSALVRPVEDQAFANIQTQVNAMRKFKGEWDTFTDLEWDMYFLEREIMAKRRPQGEQPDYHSEVALIARMGRFQAAAILDDINTKMWLRDAHSLPALPPIPMHFILRSEQVKKLEAKGKAA